MNKEILLENPKLIKIKNPDILTVLEKFFPKGFYSALSQMERGELDKTDMLLDKTISNRNSRIPSHLYRE